MTEHARLPTPIPPEIPASRTDSDRRPSVKERFTFVYVYVFA